MAISAYLLKELCARLKPGDTIASMGYPDIIAPANLVEKMLDGKFSDLVYREDSEKICKRHRIKESRKIPDSESFFRLLDCGLDVFDIEKERGCEIYMNLNDSCIHPRIGSYEIVIDIGTLEHCFNIAQAAENMVNLLRVEGHIFHENPFLMGNHGFYSMNPTWYHDFYGQTGFKLISCVMKTFDGRVKEVNTAERFIYEGPEANIVAIAQKTDLAVPRWPMQTKYAKGN